MQTRSNPSVLRFFAVAAFTLLIAPWVDAQTPPPKNAAAPSAPRPAPAPKPMTNADVIKLVQGGLADDLIAMAIRKAPRTAFDLSADGLLDLKSKSVSNAILRMMLDPTAKFEAAQSPTPTTSPNAAPAASATTPAASAATKSESIDRASPTTETTARTPLSGGSTFSVAKAYGDVWDAVLAYLKKQGQAIAVSNPQTGEIVTAMTVSGGRTQVGRRIEIALTRENPTSTSLRVAVTVQPRKKGGKDAWGDPKVDARQSQLAADELKGLLTGA